MENYLGRIVRIVIRMVGRNNPRKNTLTKHQDTTRKNYPSPKNTTMYTLPNQHHSDMNDCDYTTLHVSQRGYVVQCRNCGSYQMAFGNIQLHICAEEFIALKDYVAIKYRNVAASTERDKRSHYICTDSQRVAMVLSVDELAQYNELLQQAWLKQTMNESIKNMN